MFSFNMFHEPTRPFNTQYRCYSVLLLPGNERHDVERGGKIIMPPSALDSLTRLNIVYPMLFKLTNKKANRDTHCGVLEFVADEGKVYLPHWMMRNLCLQEGGLLQVESATLPIATFSRFQPQSPDFLDITNPKAVLENALRIFACLTTGDMIAIKYNDKVYELLVQETQPGAAVSIIECDMNVEFAAPIGYKEPTYFRRQDLQNMDEDANIAADGTESSEDNTNFVAFTGAGNRLDGKSKGKDDPLAKIMKTPMKRGIPDYEYKIGTLRFIRNQKPANSASDARETPDQFLAFSGKGKLLKS